MGIFLVLASFVQQRSGIYKRCQYECYTWHIQIEPLNCTKSAQNMLKRNINKLELNKMQFFYDEKKTNVGFFCTFAIVCQCFSLTL